MTRSVPDAAPRAWVDVDLEALVANARTIAARCGRPLLPMVKANGYGLGAVAVARALEVLDPWGFGVATPEEGRELRAAGIGRPIVVFTPLQPRSIPFLITHELRPAIGDPGAVRWWAEAAAGRPFHLEIDTGMTRAGIRWNDDDALTEVSSLLAGADGWEGVFTHFHSAETDPESIDEQWTRFERVVAGLPRRPALVHAANSAAALRGTRHAADLVRPGIFLYGGSAGGGLPEPRAVARLRAAVVATRRVGAGDTAGYGAAWRAARPTTVATLGIGYADGVLRSLGGSGVVELGGRVLPIVGRVTMDMTLVDAGEHGALGGEVATVYGGAVSLEDQAARARTISYELLTALGDRVERRYGAGS